MNKAGRCILVFAWLILVGAALNISNGAINQLTGENRPAIVKAAYVQENIRVSFMGQSYAWDADKLGKTIHFLLGKSRQTAEDTAAYFIRYQKIFQAVFMP